MKMITKNTGNNNLNLLVELVRTDFKLRYQGSALGYFWSLLRPLLMFLILYIVFVKVFPLGQGVAHYPVYLLTGIVVWNFFFEMTTRGLTSVVDRGDLIRKIKIPRLTIVLSTSFSALINFILNILVVAIFAYFNHVQIGLSALLAILLIAELYIFALGISLLLASIYVKYRDTSYIWEVVTQAGFYLTPIIYPVSKITNLSVKKIMLLNPVAQISQDLRRVAINGSSETVSSIWGSSAYRTVPVLIVGLVFIVGLAYFKSNSRYFAENI